MPKQVNYLHEVFYTSLTIHPGVATYFAILNGQDQVWSIKGAFK